MIAMRLLLVWSWQLTSGAGFVAILAAAFLVVPLAAVLGPLGAFWRAVVLWELAGFGATGAAPSPKRVGPGGGASFVRHRDGGSFLRFRARRFITRVPEKIKSKRRLQRHEPTGE